MQTDTSAVLSSAAEAVTLISLPSVLDSAISDGIAEIAKAFPGRFTESSPALPVSFRRLPAEPGMRRLALKQDAEGCIQIEFSRPCEAFRTLGILMGRLESGRPLDDHEEQGAFESLGVMLDVSRNGVLRMDAVQKLIRHLALMGMNQLMLYTEDTYEIPGEPLFGYFRGGYSQQELTAIDDYAAKLGIEVVPCIQTLGHLEQILQWPPYRPLQDTAGVLLAGDPATEALIEKMLVAASAPFRSRRIHIGMDEAHGIGSGQYRLRNGLKPPFEILTQHLKSTTALCNKLGLSPMIWSDMFFRLGSKTNEYYDRKSVISPDVAAQVPSDVALVYWDYYHTDREFYDDWIARHRAMGKEPIFAAGVWTWSRWWAALPHSLATIRAGMASARDNGLKEAFVTMWGDDGMECDVFSALPALQFFAELAYAPAAVADDNLPVHFRGSCAASSESWIATSDLDCLPTLGDPALVNANPSKWMLWHDPLLNHLDHHIHPSLPAHYSNLAARCAERAAESPEDARLGFTGKTAEILSLKTALHLALRPAYHAKDRTVIRSIVDKTIPELQKGIRELWQLHYTRWHSIYKPFGWETLERRYGGLLARFETLDRKLRLWLETAHPIDELECKSCTIYPAGEAAGLTLTHHQASTPSRIG